jgi:hypothetical protein
MYENLLEGLNSITIINSCSAQKYIQDGCYLNECIRDNSLQNNDNTTCKQLSEEITKNAKIITQDIVLFRGVEKNIDYCINKAFVSTSPEFLCAREFTNNIVLHIHIPINTTINAIKIENTKEKSEHANESEVLFQKCTCFKEITNECLKIKLIKWGIEQNLYKQVSDNKVVFINCPCIEIKFVEIANTPQTGGIISQIRLCSNQKLYKIKYNQNNQKYIKFNKKNILL